MRDFNHTVGVLVTAYFDGNLEHGVCNACAVGNIVKASLPSEHPPQYIHMGWPTVFVTDTGKQKLLPNNYAGEAKRQIDATGYTYQELARIERAFESTDGCNYCDPELSDRDMFNGLMAVVDVLADIHGINLQHKEEAKALFVKH